MRVNIECDTPLCQDGCVSEVKRSYRGVSADDRRDQRRRVLLEACLDLVGRGGTPAVTAESVSAEAKLTKRYFYESFIDRDAILVAALDELFTDVIAQIREASRRAEPAERARAITEVVVTALCSDPRRARLYAESPAVPALQSRREDAITAVTNVIANDNPNAGPGDTVPRELVTRIFIAGGTDLVTSWINGTLAADRATLTEAIVAMGRTLDIAVASAAKHATTAGTAQ